MILLNLNAGVPFGEVAITKSWLDIDNVVGKPPLEHPKKIVKGFLSKRKEVSGSRFWSYFQSKCYYPQGITYGEILLIDEILTTQYSILIGFSLFSKLPCLQPLSTLVYERNG